MISHYIIQNEKGAFFNEVRWFDEYPEAAKFLSLKNVKSCTQHVKKHFPSIKFSVIKNYGFETQEIVEV